MASGPDPGARVDAIDLLRGVAIACVVMHHVSWRLLTPEAVASPGGSVVAVALMASDLGVPLFVAISAFGLAWRHGAPFGGPGGWLAFLGRRASRLLPAYVLWSLVSLVARDPGLLASPHGVASALLFGSADVQFYYVPMVFELYLLWPLARPLLASASPIVAAVALAAGWGLAELAWGWLIVPVWTPLLFYAVPVAVGAALRFPAAVAGAHAARPFASPLSAPRAVAAALLAAAGLAALGLSASGVLAAAPEQASRGALFSLSMVPAREQALFAACATVAVALVASPLARTRLGMALAALGRASYGVYLVHLLVASTLVYRFTGMDAAARGDGGAFLPLFGAWGATLVVSFVLVRLVERFPALRWSVGSR